MFGKAATRRRAPRVCVSLHCPVMSEAGEVVTKALYQIGEVAAQIGLSQRTIRHYDDLGILKPSARTVGGFRLYTDADVQRFLLIKPLKPLGIGLEDVRRITDALDTLDAADADDEAVAAARDRIGMVVELITVRRAELSRSMEAADLTISALQRALPGRAVPDGGEVGADGLR